MSSGKKWNGPHRDKDRSRTPRVTVEDRRAAERAAANYAKAQGCAWRVVEVAR